MKLIVCLFAVLAVVWSASAGPSTNAPSVTLAWDQVVDPAVNGYAVYWGTASRQYTNSILVNGQTNLTCTISNLARLTHYYFAATSRATNGLESDYSNEADYTTLALPPPPSGTKVTVKNP